MNRQFQVSRPNALWVSDPRFHHSEPAPAGSKPGGRLYDNALAESIIGLYKTELIRHSRESGNRRGPWRHCEAVELATLEWVHWYNHRRLFGPLGHVPPAAFEAHYSHQLHESAMAA